MTSKTNMKEIISELGAEVSRLRKELELEKNTPVRKRMFEIGYRQAISDFNQILNNYCYCSNCRFSCQATECECICHQGVWIRKDDIKQQLKELKERKCHN